MAYLSVETARAYRRVKARRADKRDEGVTLSVSLSLSREERPLTTKYFRRLRLPLLDLRQSAR